MACWFQRWWGESQLRCIQWRATNPLCGAHVVGGPSRPKVVDAVGGGGGRENRSSRFGLLLERKGPFPDWRERAEEK